MNKSIYPYFQEKKWITKNKDSKNKKMYRDLEVQMSKGFLKFYMYNLYRRFNSKNNGFFLI